jgi:hypothetical protein
MLHLFFVAKYEACNIECRSADIGQLDAPAKAHKQFGAVTFLEILDLTGQCRLRDVEHFRGACEAAVRCDRVKGAKVGM